MSTKRLDDFLNEISNRDNKPEFETKKSLLYSYFDSLVASLNLEASKLGSVFSFALPSDDDISGLAGKIPSPEKFDKEFEKIHPEQITSAFEVIRSIVAEDLSQEHVTGLTQMGKSGLITVLMDLLGISSFILTNRQKILLPIAWLPNAINMERQSIRKLSQSSLLNGHITVLWDKKSFKIRDFNARVKKQLSSEISKTIDIMAQSGRIEVIHKTKLLQEISEFFGTEEEQSALVLRRSTVSDQMYEWLFQAASESESSDLIKEINIALIMDESHIAIGKGQGAGRILIQDIPNLHTVLADTNRGEDLEIDEGEADSDDLTEAEKAQLLEEQKETFQEFEESQNVSNTYTRIFGNKAKLVTVSATNTPWNCVKYLEGKQPVFLKVGEGYCGFPFVDGQDYPLEPGIEVVEPIVKPMRELADKVPNIKHLNLRHLDSAFSYAQSLYWDDWRSIYEVLNNHMAVLATRLRGDIRKQLRTFEDNGFSRNRAAKVLDKVFDSQAKELVELTEVIRNACELNRLVEKSEFKALFTLPNEKQRKAKLKRLCGDNKSLEVAWKVSYEKAQEALAQLLKYLLLDENPQNKKGCILRWECKNESFDSFIQPLEARLGNKIRFIPYMGSNASETVPELLAKVNPGKAPYVIIVTGRGRYGESYPSDCGYAIDGTTKNASSAAFFQSLIGRISGYNKYDRDQPETTRPMVILSDLAYDHVFLELKKGKGYSPKVGTGGILTRTGMDFKPFEVIPIIRCPENTDIEPLFERLDSLLVPNQGTILNQLSKRIQDDLFSVIEPIAEYVEKHPSLALDALGIKDFQDAAGGEGLQFLRPGQTVNDDSGRMLDWHDRKEDDATPPPNARTFVTFEFLNGGRKKFGLTSLRNNKRGAEYLHTGLQLDKDSYRVKAIWLWLQTPVFSKVTGPFNGAVVPRRGSVPDEFLRRSGG